jgi:S1-C subfamily serine protease
MTTAKFVGSDRQTNLTVLKLESSIGRPVHLTGSRPSDGSLVMVLSPAGDSGKLGVWTGGQQDRGIVVAMDGSVAGFARYGQFLSGAFAKPVVDQLIQFGRVKRATLGVLVEETETPDGGRGMRVDRVAPDSPAGQVGVRPGDFILSMGGAPVGDLPSFAAAIAARDGETELQILRGEKTFTVTVVLHPK